MFLGYPLSCREASQHPAAPQRLASNRHRSKGSGGAPRQKAAACMGSFSSPASKWLRGGFLTSPGGHDGHWNFDRIRRCLQEASWIDRLNPTGSIPAAQAVPSARISISFNFTGFQEMPGPGRCHAYPLSILRHAGIGKVDLGSRSVPTPFPGLPALTKPRRDSRFARTVLLGRGPASETWSGRRTPRNSCFRSFNTKEAHSKLHILVIALMYPPLRTQRLSAL